MTFTATPSGITLPAIPAGVQSLDVCFGEDRVWSLDMGDLPRTRRGRLPWPAPMRPHLIGSTRVALRESGTGRELAACDARFTDDDATTRIRDDAGVPLAINKWGRLGKTLEHGNAGVQERILDRTQEVIRALAAMGKRPFAVGGTLLGAVRDRALLPHDDDADIAYLSHHTNPADVAREGFEVGRALEALGYELVRHSATHMQLYFRDGAGRLDYYVDVFAAFFTADGRINQPFHVRGEMREDQMLPFGTVAVQGRELPAPAARERWLEINYDENWRTPLPGYRLKTPEGTIRRFENWFGSFHFMRDFWNEFYAPQQSSADRAWRSGAEWILRRDRTLTSGWLIDLGCGTGELAADLLARDPARRVVAADYSPYALEAAARHRGEGLSVAHANLHRLSSLALPQRAGVDGAFDLVANHLFDVLGPRALPQAMRLARMALRSGGSALATLYGKPALDEPDAPTSWALPPSEFAALAARFGLHAEISPFKAASRERGRAPYGARLRLAPSPAKETP